MEVLPCPCPPTVRRSWPRSAATFVLWVILHHQPDQPWKQCVSMRCVQDKPTKGQWTWNVASTIKAGVPDLKKKWERANWGPTFISLCFLTADTMWPAALFCCYASWLQRAALTFPSICCFVQEFCHSVGTSDSYQLSRGRSIGYARSELEDLPTPCSQAESSKEFTRDGENRDEYLSGSPGLS